MENKSNEAGKTKLPDRIQPFGTFGTFGTECSPGEIQEAQLVHAVETNNFQPSHVGFSSS